MTDFKENIKNIERNPNLEYIQIPASTYTLEKECQQHREDNLHKTIRWLIIGWFVSVILVAIGITGGFIWYLNQFDFYYEEYSQSTEVGNDGNATIEDGIHYNYGLE